MQNICLLISTLMVIINIKLTKSEYDNLPANSEYDHTFSKNSRENENWFDQNTVLGNSHQARTISEPEEMKDYEYTANMQTPQYEDAARFLFNSYVNLLRKNVKLAEDRESSDRRNRIDKRAITMLSRWKPFRLTTSTSSSNGRHVIRSPYVSRAASPDKIMGRPFRWG